MDSGAIEPGRAQPIMPPTKPSLRRDNLRVASLKQPGWHACDGSVPRLGECVLCVHGRAEVVRLLGRTSDGGRVLELRLNDKPDTPYYAAASNVLRRSERDEAEASSTRPPEPSPVQIIGGTAMDFIGL